MRSSRTLGTELWREIVERLDEGVIVFNQRGVAIYANDEAARLLGYDPRDVLELEKDDVIALTDSDRADGARFAHAFLAERISPEDARPYEIVTTSRRLIVHPLALTLEHGEVTLLLLREAYAWRSDLVASTVATEMQGPLAVIDHYIAMLIDRLHDQTAHPFELNDLARIIKESLSRAMGLWDWLARLYSTDPRQGLAPARIAPVRVEKVMQVALTALEQSLGQPAPHLRLDAAAGLPAVSGSQPDLQAAFHILLQQSAARLPETGSLVIVIRARDHFVQIDLKPDPPAHTLHSHYFDLLPLAIAEQIIMRHGGRVWFGGGGQSPTKVSLSLPTWESDEPAGPAMSSALPPH